jgi:hypothetical protein
MIQENGSEERVRFPFPSRTEPTKIIGYKNYVLKHKDF